MASHLLQMRNYYFTNNDKTFFDEGIFQDFVINCIGEAVDDRILKQEEYKSKKNKIMSFKYSPEDNKKFNADDWTFSNMSGNEIRNKKNYKITRLLKLIEISFAKKGSIY